MSEHDDDHESFEETLRAIAHELSESVERAMSQIDVDEIARSMGIDPERTRSWFESATEWMRGRVEEQPGFPDVVPRRDPAKRRPEPAIGDPLRGAAPHPLDVPTEEQGLALAALESGRWTVEPGTEALAAHGEGPGPSEALGLVRELRARDWIAADGKLTAVGRHALSRWLEAAARS